MKVGVVNYIWNNDLVWNTLQEIILVGFNYNVVTFYITADESSAKYDIKSVVPVLRTLYLPLNLAKNSIFNC